MFTIHSFKKWQFLMVILLTLLLFVGCASNNGDDGESEAANEGTAKSGESDSPQSGGTVTIGVSQEPDTLDIHKSTMSIANIITTQIGGTLFTFDPETMELMTSIAEDYSISDDGMTITLEIRDDVTFHDGTPLTAEVFKETFERILNPDTGSTVAASQAVAIDSITVEDEHTLIIDLIDASVPFLSNLGTSYFQPLSMDAIEELGDDFGRNPVGIGPWEFVDWKTGQEIILKRNDNFNWAPSFYKNDGAAYPDELIYKFITDEQTMISALDTGAIDIASSVPAKEAKRYRDNNEFYVVETELQGLSLLVEMNLDHEVLNDINVRKAINLAINKEAIIDAVAEGEGTPAYGPISSTLFGYDPEVENYGYKYNQDEAVALLEESGWHKNSNGIMEKGNEKLHLTLAISDMNERDAQIVQAMLKEIGIDIEIQMMEDATLVEKLSEGDYELSFLSYTHVDPDVLFLLFHSSQIGGLNHVRVENAELDALLEEQRVIIDPDERQQVLAEIQQIIIEEAYWAPVYAGKEFSVINKRLHDVFMTPNGLALHDMWVEK